MDRQLPRLLSRKASAGTHAEARAIAVQQRAETVIAALAALRDRPDRSPELGHITCPVLVVVGADDVLTPPAEAAAMAGAIPTARLVTLDGAGHMANLEAPGAFAAALADFLTSEPPQRPLSR